MNVLISCTYLWLSCWFKFPFAYPHEYTIYIFNSELFQWIDNLDQYIRSSNTMFHSLRSYNFHFICMRVDRQPSTSIGLARGNCCSSANPISWVDEFLGIGKNPSVPLMICFLVYQTNSSFSATSSPPPHQRHLEVNARTKRLEKKLQRLQGIRSEYCFYQPSPNARVRYWIRPSLWFWCPQFRKILSYENPFLHVISPEPGFLPTGRKQGSGITFVKYTSQKWYDCTMISNTLLHHNFGCATVTLIFHPRIFLNIEAKEKRIA